MPTFLHVGCGPKGKAQTTEGFKRPEWTEMRLDIDPAARPDIVGTMTDLSQIPSGSVQGIFSSHNIEHLYPHEAPMALAEFHRVLSPDGFVVVTCPDIQQVAILVAEGRLNEPIYQSGQGPIAPIDILYGHRASLAAGNLFMAHRSAFTLTSLHEALKAAGFVSLLAMRRRTHMDLWALGTKTEASEAQLEALGRAHLPA